MSDDSESSRKSERGKSNPNTDNQINEDSTDNAESYQVGSISESEAISDDEDDVFYSFEQDNNSTLLDDIHIVEEMPVLADEETVVESLNSVVEESLSPTDLSTPDELEIDFDEDDEFYNMSMSSESSEADAENEPTLEFSLIDYPEIVHTTSTSLSAADETSVNFNFHIGRIKPEIGVIPHLLRKIMSTVKKFTNCKECIIYVRTSERTCGFVSLLDSEDDLTISKNVDTTGDYIILESRKIPTVVFKDICEKFPRQDRAPVFENFGRIFSFEPTTYITNSMASAMVDGSDNIAGVVQCNDCTVGVNFTESQLKHFVPIAIHIGNIIIASYLSQHRMRAVNLTALYLEMFRNQIDDTKFSNDVQGYIRSLDVMARRHQQNDYEESAAVGNEEQSESDSGVTSNNNLNGFLEGVSNNQSNNDWADEMIENQLIQRYSCNCSIAGEHIQKIQCINTCLQNFESLNFHLNLNIDIKNLCNFLCCIRKCYRNVPYHNWMHAVRSSCAMTNILNNIPMNDLFTEPEKLALMVASVVHDIDHRGKTNYFHVRSVDPLLIVYQTSCPLELQQFDLVEKIILISECNFLKEWHMSEFRNVVGIVKECIVETSEENITSIKDRFVGEVALYHLLKEHWKRNRTRKHLLMKILLLISDMIFMYCPWDEHLKMVKLLQTEYFNQGDIEQLVGNTPRLPHHQRSLSDYFGLFMISMISNIGLPLLQSLESLFHCQFGTWLQNANINLRLWESRIQAVSADANLATFAITQAYHGFPPEM